MLVAFALQKLLIFLQQKVSMYLQYFKKEILMSNLRVKKEKHTEYLAGVANFPETN